MTSGQTVALSELDSKVVESVLNEVFRDDALGSRAEWFQSGWSQSGKVPEPIPVSGVATYSPDEDVSLTAFADLGDLYDD